MGKSTAEYRKHPLLAALGVIAALGVAGCASSTMFTTRAAAGRLPPIPQVTALDQQEIAYLRRANQVVFKHHEDCVPLQQGRHRVRDDGTPSQAMLSSFAVLKRPSKARLPSDWALPGGQNVYVNYVRIAQTRFGWPFKIIPLAHVTTTSSRCLALEALEVHTLIAHAPAQVRAKVEAVEHDAQLDHRYVERHPEGICISGGHYGSVCGSLLDALARGALSYGGSSATGPVSFDLVPNAVASITARYPKQPGSPARAINVPVIHNLAVWKATNEPGDVVPTIIWRAAGGRSIRTIRDEF